MRTINFKRTIRSKFQLLDFYLNNGFSLLETLIAITVITIGLVGVTGLIVYNISISRASPERVIAVNLAQEGIEAVRNIRDSNWLAGVGWKDGIRGTGNQQRGIVNYNSGFSGFPGAAVSNIEDCDDSSDMPVGDACRLYIDGNGFYSHDSNGTSTNYFRLIKLTQINPDELKIVSEVKWIEDSQVHSPIIIEGYLYNFIRPSAPARYYWSLYGSDFRRIPNPPCATSQRAPCDEDMVSFINECWALPGHRAFGGDPDCVYDMVGDDPRRGGFQGQYYIYLKVKY